MAVTLSLPRISSGDMMIAIAVATLLLASAYPAMRERAFARSVRETQADIEALRRGAQGHLRDHGAWPTTGAPGVVPVELRAALPDPSAMAGDDYRLQWMRFEVVDSVEAVPDPNPDPIPGDTPPESLPTPVVPVAREVGGLVVFTTDEALLAELLERYGRDVSFVRDTSWTLMLPDRAGGP